MKYKIQGGEIDAIQFAGDNDAEISDFGAKIRRSLTLLREEKNIYGRIENLQIEILEVFDHIQGEWLTVEPFAFIIHGTRGEYFPCQESEFKRLYTDL